MCKGKQKLGYFFFFLHKETTKHTHTIGELQVQCQALAETAYCSLPVSLSIRADFKCDSGWEEKNRHPLSKGKGVCALGGCDYQHSTYAPYIQM